MRLPNSVAVAILETASFIGSVVAPLVAGLFPVRVDRDVPVPTWSGGETLVDVYTPAAAQPPGGWPVQVLFHGGGFRFFSKESHALVAAKLCAFGSLVITANYRLAPEHPFPHGLLDALSVYDWAVRHAVRWGGNVSDVTVSGESAGANFALAVPLVAARLVPPPEPHAAFDVSAWPMPNRVIVQGGYLQTSATERFDAEPISELVRERTRMIQRNYLPRSWPSPATPRDWGLADPLCVVERLTEAPPRFPHVFIPVGGNDPVLSDSRRLAQALTRLGLPHRLAEYPNGPHALYALPFHPQYDPCWRDIEAFLTGAARST